MRFATALTPVLAIAAMLPQAAHGAGWSKVPVPQNSGLAAVSCVSVRSCDGVGSWRNRPIAERWNGVRWSMQTIRAPAEALLAGVTCRSSRACVAVGQYVSRSPRVTKPLIERFDGKRWSVQSAPARSVPGDRFGALNVLNAVACPAANLCFAVGATTPRGRGQVPGSPLIERWDGKRWQLVTTRSSSGPLDSISCTSPRFCLAAGGVELAQGQASNPQIGDATVSMRWDGRNWSVQPIPTPAGADGARLMAVSCITSSNCFGVGSSLQNDSMDPVNPVEVDHAMTGRWDGSAWSTETLPSAAGSPTVDNFPLEQLKAVSCATATACGAVGLARDNTGRLGPLAARWDGSNWTQTLLRVGAPVALNSVSCPSARWCMAVGPTRAERYSAD